MSEPAVPLDVPGAELQFKLAGSMGSMGSYTSAWLFQIAHAPTFLCKDELAESFFSSRLEKAFSSLKSKFGQFQSAAPLYLGPHTNFRHPSEGCDDYYLFTNVCGQISEDQLERFSIKAQTLFTQILGVPSDRHPGFGMGTPETVSGASYSDVKTAVVDLLNTPSSYYFVAREGEISVAAVTEHGAFLASNQGQKGGASSLGFSTTITSRLSPDCCLGATALADFETLINAGGTKEADLQAFLNNHPQFLFGIDERYCEIRSHICLFDGKRERLVPDFMVRLEDSDLWDIVELKHPQHSMIVRNGAAERPSAPAARAIKELLEYRDFFSLRNNRRRIMHRAGTAPYEPCLVLVIGRGHSTERYEWRTALAGFPCINIVSYDYLFEKARAAAGVLRRT